MIRAARRAHASTAAGPRGDCGDGGFTLVELLVAISFFAVLSTAVFSLLSSTAKTVNDVRSITNLTEEARVATERIVRELRQASEIRDAHLPVNDQDYTSITFGVDFNGLLGVELDALDPEIVEYRFDPPTDPSQTGSGKLTFIANPSGTPVNAPILTANVTGFELAFTSSLWEYDTKGKPDGTPDGVTDWTEIDASALGNHNGEFDALEFRWIDSVGITIHLLDGAREQTYTTRVDLRNRNLN